MADLIDRAALYEKIQPVDFLYGHDEDAPYSGMAVAACDIEDAAAIDAVEVEALKAWLYEIAMNNTSNYLGDACEEIISRLDGLRVFARERRTDATD